MKISWNIFVVAVIIVCLFFISCDSASSGSDNSDTAATTKNQAEEINDSAMASNAAEKDAQFMVDVAASNYGEVKLAKLALQKSSSKEIKEVAKIIETDHSAVMSDLKTLSASKGITIPSEESGEAKDKLKELANENTSGFDKEWCEILMDNHKNSISKFENAANNVSDPDLKNFVNTVLPKLRTHHDRLMECHKKLK